MIKQTRLACLGFPIVAEIFRTQMARQRLSGVAQFPWEASSGCYVPACCNMLSAGRSRPDTDCANFLGENASNTQKERAMDWRERIGDARQVLPDWPRASGRLGRPARASKAAMARGWRARMLA